MDYEAWFQKGRMLDDPNSREGSHFHESECAGYKDKVLEKLRNGTLLGKLPDGDFMCPFYEYENSLPETQMYNFLSTAEYTIEKWKKF
ncbi:hypothetical protein L1887_05448 [Cichorium endivia]|nr:hypothetical protein L1887_05448 [Cichorium endivia]